MIDPSQVSAVVVTRGNRGISQVLASLSMFGEVFVYDNSKLPDYKVYGRYVGIAKALFPVVYTQDDDCIIDAASVCADYRPGKLVCNMKPAHHEWYRREFPGVALVGHGAIFDRDLVNFKPYSDRFPHPTHDDLFLRECDRVFTFLNRDRQVWTAHDITDLPHADDPSTSMWREGRHMYDLRWIYDRLQSTTTRTNSQIHESIGADLTWTFQNQE